MKSATSSPLRKKSKSQTTNYPVTPNGTILLDTPPVPQPSTTSNHPTNKSPSYADVVKHGSTPVTKFTPKTTPSSLNEMKSLEASLQKDVIELLSSSEKKPAALPKLLNPDMLSGNRRGKLSFPTSHDSSVFPLKPVVPSPATTFDGDAFSFIKKHLPSTAYPILSSYSYEHLESTKLSPEIRDSLHKAAITSIEKVLGGERETIKNAVSALNAMHRGGIDELQIRVGKCPTPARSYGVETSLADPSSFEKAGVARSKVPTALAYDTSMLPYYDANGVLLNGVHVFFINGRLKCIEDNDHCKPITKEEARIRASIKAMAETVGNIAIFEEMAKCINLPFIGKPESIEENKQRATIQAKASGKARMASMTEEEKFEFASAGGKARMASMTEEEKFAFTSASGKARMASMTEEEKFAFTSAGGKARMASMTEEEKFAFTSAGGKASKKVYLEEKWNRHFESLLRYRDDYGTTNVPQDFKYPEEDITLGAWVAHQRVQFGNFMRGDAEAMINQFRIDALNSIGFVWNTYRSAWDEWADIYEQWVKDNGGKWKPKTKETIMIGGKERKIGLWYNHLRHSI
eukprot:scaffold5636_cov73-Cyclotella_meneghiniana.AAC.7